MSETYHLHTTHNEERMNIFILDADQKRSAKFHVKSHITKMPLETAQILSTAVRKHFEHIPPSKLYKKTHENHPCCVWASKTRSNFIWLVEFGYYLFKEFEYRRGKQHKSFKIIDAAWNCKHLIPEGDRTPFALAMPDKYKSIGDPVKSYRTYYKEEKSHLANWECRVKPHWW